MSDPLVISPDSVSSIKGALGVRHPGWQLLRCCRVRSYCIRGASRLGLRPVVSQRYGLLPKSVHLLAMRVTGDRDLPMAELSFRVPVALRSTWSGDGVAMNLDRVATASLPFLVPSGAPPPLAAWHGDGLVATAGFRDMRFVPGALLLLSGGRVAFRLDQEQGREPVAFERVEI